MLEEKTFKEVIGRLEKAHIPYMLTGGVAVTIWGRTRSTFDIDIVIDLREKDKHKVLELFQKDFYIDEDAFESDRTFNMIDRVSTEKVDFYPIQEGDLYEEERLNRRRTIKLLGIDVQVISPEDLILIKLQWFKQSESTRHLEDAESILKISKVDVRYIEKWAEKQGTREIFEKLAKHEA